MRTPRLVLGSVPAPPGNTAWYDALRLGAIFSVATPWTSTLTAPINVLVVPTIRKNRTLGVFVTPWRVAVSVTGFPNTTVPRLALRPRDVPVFATSIWTFKLVAAVWVSSPAHVAQ